jgi:hypothetical protein
LTLLFKKTLHGICDCDEVIVDPLKDASITAAFAQSC